MFRFSFGSLKSHLKEYPILYSGNFKTIFWTSSCKYTKNKVYGFNPDIASCSLNINHEYPDIFIVRSENANLHRFITAYREYGHLKANMNPLVPNARSVPELNPSLYGISLDEKSIATDGLNLGTDDVTISGRELINLLEQIYCGELCAEFMHLPSIKEREWFANELEKLKYVSLTKEEQTAVAKDTLNSQVWDKFLGLKFPTAKRYGAEGAESSITFYRETFQQLSQDGVEELVLGMCHRGRLNLLILLLQVAPELMFHKLKGLSEYPPNSLGYGDVLSHFISSVDLDVGGSKPLHVTMLYNPSHLEIQDPVACGKTRGRQRTLKEGHYSTHENVRPGDKVVCMQVHGDGALSGQGIVQETLNMAEVPNFCIGGSIHLCINNQISYTTPPERGRSSLYCTDIAKMNSFPIIHVNGDYPEAVAKSARLAAAYNRRFRRDVFIDLNCWRRWGHNELDDPRFTNPRMYKIIDNRMSVPDCYAASLIEAKVLSEDDKKEIEDSFFAYLSEKLKVVDHYVPQQSHLLKHWNSMKEAPDHIQTWNTGVDIPLLKYLGSKSVQLPENFSVHPHVQKTHISSRLEKLSSGQNIDWATGEMLAIASLIYQGYDVRLSGEDVGRGTFSQRHCTFVDQDTDEVFIPINNIDCDQSNFLEVANSILSEEAVLGFEYGISIESPRILCIWEAQFGDFFNGAQTVFDTYISSGEEKWLTQSGIVVLLPHGYDGAGPDHSSCRLERFLQMSNSGEIQPDSERVNWNIIFPTTSAQIFHALRRQMIRNYRKPLIVVGPKSILRLPSAFSTLQDMAPGTYFLPVIGDDFIDPEKVKKVIFVSGKHFYFLNAHREKFDIKDVAIIRIESLCPFPTHHINEQLAKFKNAKSFIWSQEEHRNMGAWSFVSSRFRNLCGKQLSYAGRPELGATAVGIGALHKAQVEDLLDQVFKC